MVYSSFPRAPDYTIGAVSNLFTKICGDIRNFVLSVGINDTGNKLFTSVNDTNNNKALSRILIDLMTLTINLLPVTTTPAII